MTVAIQLRRDTGANWTSVNPVLADGEIGINTDDLSYKIGDGVTAWNALLYRELTGVFGGGLTLDAIANPSAPPAGSMALYAHNIGGRLIPKFMGPAGLDTPIQPALWANGIVRVGPNASTSFSVEGAAAPTVVGTASTPAPTAGTNLLTATRRTRITSAATANSVNDVRMAATPVYRGEVFGAAVSGGFFYSTRWAAPSTTALQRTFVGLVGSTGALATTLDPLAITNSIGVGNSSADANLQMITNDGAGNAPKIDLGANFPASNAAAMYDLTMFCKPNGDEVAWRVMRLDTGDVASGVLTSELPAKTTMLYPRAYMNNGGTAAAVILDLMRIYLETDY